MQRLFEQPRFYYALFVVLLLPALLINLGVHHIFVHTDESRRALVALEMILSEQYIAPTLNGEWYYNKPPLYNWIIALSFKTFGAYSTFALRFPVVLSILAFGAVIWGFVRPAMGSAFAWVLVMATITSGRILFYDAFLGLIDIAFSTLVFANFMLFYSLGRKGPSLLLFSLSYSIAAVAYLMKGLPPVVFQAFTVLAWAVYRKDWKGIFHWSHFVGALFFVGPVGLYYFAYLQINPQSLEVLFTTIFEESSNRTVTTHGWWATFLSLFRFPLDNLYHFAPWTLLVLCLFGKGIWKQLWAHDFVRWCILVFGFNIVVYWTSPGVHPRYLFMFLPLFFAVLLHAFNTVNPGLKRASLIVIQTLMAVAMLTPVAVYFFVLEASGVLEVVKLVTLFVPLLALFLVSLRYKQYRLLILGSYLLVLRIGFNWFILPERDAKGWGYTTGALQVLEIVGDSPLYLLPPNYCHNGTSFIISSAREEILRVADHPEPDVYYIIHQDALNDFAFRPLLEFKTQDIKSSLFLVQLSGPVGVGTAD